MKTKPVRILMIEDEPQHVRLIQALLERSRYRDYELVSADRAQSGLEHLSEDSFDVVLLDLGLPDSQGLETFHKVQSQSPYIPIVINSALSDHAIAIEAVKSGAQDYLVKGEVSAEIVSRALNYAIERKRAELTLRESEEKYRRLIETMSGVLYQMSFPEGVYEYISPMCLQAFGYPPEDFLKKPVLLRDIIHSDSDSYFREQWSNLTEGKITPVWEYKVIDPEGNERWITQSNRGVFNEHGSLIAIEGICLNITRTKQREEELNHLSSVMEQSTEGMAFCDLEGNLISVNSTFATMHGYTRRELVGKHISIFYAVEQVPLLEETWQQIHEEGSYNGEMWHVRSDGTSFLCQMSISIIFNDAGKPIGIGETVRDITELREAEEELRTTHVRLQEAHEQLKASQEQLIQAEKMSAVGTMVAGVAHELNNPLTGILQFARYCMKYTDEVDKRYPILQDIVDETIRCADIVNNLLTFSTMGDQEEYETLDCNVVLDRVIRLLSYRIERENVSLVRNTAEELPRVQVRANTIQQVFLNLIANSLDAVQTSERKEISIDIRTVGEFVQVTIVDTGVGVPVEDLNKVFDPFFTTKPPGKGTGLGLTVTRNIVMDHGGNIICKSEPGGGTRLVVTLPAEKQNRTKIKG